jgi:hypothetical protein
LANDFFRQINSALPPSAEIWLEEYLERTTRSYDVDLRTPLFDEAPREDVIADLEHAIGDTGFEDFDAINAHEKEKIGPESQRDSFDERRPLVAEYTGAGLDADLEILEACVQEEVKRLPPRSLRPLSFDTVRGSVFRGHKLRGFPWLTTDESQDEWYMAQAPSVRSYLEMWPYLIGWRGQHRGLHLRPKQRTVAMSQKVELLLSATTLYPVVNALKGSEGYAAWMGPEYVDMAMTRILRRARGRLIISGDYESFDASVNRVLLDAVKRIRQVWYGNEDVTARYEITTDYLARGAIIVPEGMMWENRNGAIASGHGHTNDFGTGVNRLAQRYVAKRAGLWVVDMETLGDDSVTVFSDNLDPATYAKYLAELGLKANPDKQFVSTDAVHYLQNWHSLRYQKDGVCKGVRSPMRALGGMMSFERWHKEWSKWLVTARLGVQCENVKNHPKFPEFVKFVKKGDRILSSGIDFLEVLRRAGGAEYVSEALDRPSFPFNVADPERANEFETTKVLRQLAAT